MAPGRALLPALMADHIADLLDIAARREVRPSGQRARQRRADRDGKDAAAGSG